MSPSCGGASAILDAYKECRLEVRKVDSEVEELYREWNDGGFSEMWCDVM